MIIVQAYNNHHGSLCYYDYSLTFSFSSVQSSRSVVSDFATPWIAAHQASLSITNSQSLLKVTSIESVMPSSSSSSSSSVVPFSSCPQCLPASRSFPMSQFFTSGGQSIGVSASASVLPKNTQEWSPLGCIGWISLQCKGLSSLLQHHSSKASILQCSAFFTDSHIHTWPMEKP